MIDGIRIYDAHMHILGRFKKRDENFIEFLDRFSIDKAIITSLNTTTTMDSIHKISEATFTKDNECNHKMQLVKNKSKNQRNAKIQSPNLDP